MERSGRGYRAPVSIRSLTKELHRRYPTPEYLTTHFGQKSQTLWTRRVGNPDERWPTLSSRSGIFRTWAARTGSRLLEATAMAAGTPLTRLTLGAAGDSSLRGREDSG